ncbi:DNA protecting protein DprA [Thermocatellispora tengchongensis]|uniref:DNA protecting protein DprA n=1 Tax=Thermocatellispora tengchongensis TaxID=1073253 RepID=A0A840PQK7_9ACTN|nr:DNA-processing protein DprA [Thermocatellispora tengchongensis]MBB5138275.1 DNA protecting protein DprA [Thermocatellispora tengchongensis]
MHDEYVTRDPHALSTQDGAPYVLPDQGVALHDPPDQRAASRVPPEQSVASPVPPEASVVSHVPPELGVASPVLRVPAVVPSMPPEPGVASHVLSEPDVVSPVLPEPSVAPHGLLGEGAALHALPDQGVAPHGAPEQGMASHGLPEQRVAPHGVPKQGVAPHGLPEQGVTSPVPPDLGVALHEPDDRGVALHVLPDQAVAPHHPHERDVTPRPVQDQDVAHHKAPSDTALDEVKLARVTLMRLADAGDPVMGRLVSLWGPLEALERIRRGDMALGPGEVGGEAGGEEGEGGESWKRFADGLRRRLGAWRARLRGVDPKRDLAVGEACGARLIVPGDIEWPSQLGDLGDTQPLGLWLNGSVNLRFSCLRSIAVVGSRAATAYGIHMAATLGAELSGAGWTVISGGAYGVDGAAHRGALTGEAPTIVVLACGVDQCYPRGHDTLFAAVRGQGLLVSECPPEVFPTRARFLIRNRLIAALSRGTVVVEAALRSGALNTANHALALQRHVGAVPGPVTSDASAGCHQLLRQGKAICVTSGEDAIDLVGLIGGDLAPDRRGPVLPRDRLSEVSRRVLDAVPARGGAGPAAIAVSAGVDLTTALSTLGTLAAAGYVHHSPKGWRIVRRP